MSTLQVRIRKVHEDAIVPAYQSEGAACFDLHTVEPGEVSAYSSVTFSIGLEFEIPCGYVMFAYSRSGHGFTWDVRLANGTGVIDSDYRGEVKAKLRNDGPLRLDISAGDRIAQAIILPYPRVQFIEADELSETARGCGGFGSTGR